MALLSKNFLFGAVIAILIITTTVFGVLLLQMKREVRMKNQEVSELQKQLQTKLTEERPQIPDTTDWKTYRNEQYGFEVKYPEAFLADGVALEPESMGDFLHIISPDCPEGVDLCSFFLDFPRRYLLDKRIVDYGRETFELNKKKGGRARDYAIQMIGGVPAATFLVEKAFVQGGIVITERGIESDPSNEVGYGRLLDIETMVVYLENNGYMFRILMPNREVFHQILSTFKFIQ